MFDLLSDIFSALKVLLIVAVVIGFIGALRFVFRFFAKRMPLVIAMAFFGAKTRADAWDLIADMMESGKDDRRSIEAVAASFESDGKFAAAISLRELARSFAIGKFTQSVRKVARGSESLVFSNAGKTSGPVVFRGAARILRNEAAIKRAVIQGLAQPTLLTFGMIGLLLIFGLKLFPAFEEIAPKSTWPGVSILIADAADMVISSGIAGAVIMGVLLLLIVISVPFLNSVEDGFTRSLRNALDFYPPWVFYRLSTGASFAFAIVEIARSGGTLNGATLTNMAKHGSRYSRLNIQRIAIALGSGASLSVAVRHAGSWPDPNLNSTLALLANEANALEKFGAYVDRWMVRAEQNVKAKSAVLNKILIFMIAGMALACVMSIFGVISSFGTSSGL